MEEWGGGSNETTPTQILSYSKPFEFVVKGQSGFTPSVQDKNEKNSEPSDSIGQEPRNWT